jgi:hypothetical protein
MIKKRFVELRNEHHFEIFGLAEQAQVHPEVVYRMLLGERVPRDYAVMVLMALSRLTGYSYTLDNVDIQLSAI